MILRLQIQIDQKLYDSEKEYERGEIEIENRVKRKKEKKSQISKVNEIGSRIILKMFLKKLLNMRLNMNMNKFMLIEKFVVDICG